VAELPGVPDQPDLSTEQVVELSGASYKTVLRRIRSGELRAYKRVGKYWVRHDDFLRWMYGNPVQPNEQLDLDLEPTVRRTRGRPERGSVAELDELERRAAR
jgi:excisionase family DNA binding protein